MGVVLGIVQGAPTSPGAMPSVPLIIAAGLPVAIAEIYVAIRLMLALPATALDGSDEFRLSWRLTRGNALRIFVAAVLGVIPFYVGAFMFEYLLAMAGLYALVPFTGTLLVVLVSMVLSAAGSTVLAMVYLRLGGPVPARV
jgi:membrane-anchored glycerophosphoryl diester phosphodiesterase (GDPDase)